MSVRPEEFRVEASRLEQQAEAAADDNARLMLGMAARRFREIADEIEQHELASRPAA